MQRRTCILMLLLVLSIVWTALQGQGVSVTIGNGDQQAGIPFNLYYRYSLFESLYYPIEIQMNGLICSLRFYSNWQGGNLEDIPIQVWLGTTTQADLSAGWIPSSQLTLVYDDSLDFSFSQNYIHLDLETPFVYTGDNLVILVRSPWQSNWLNQSPNFYCQTLGTSRARNFYSDTVNPDPTNPPLTGSVLSGQFPKTTLYFVTSPWFYDLSAANLTGNVTPVEDNVSYYLVDITNNGIMDIGQYTVKLYNGSDQLLVTVPHNSSIPSGAVQQISIPFTPADAGLLSIYAKVETAMDQEPSNNQSNSLILAVQPSGAIIDPPITYILERVPLDFYYKNSLYETVFDETWWSLGLIPSPAHITGLTWYNNFTSNALSLGKPTVIWLGNTDLEDLSGGWIPSTDLTLVFDGNVSYPMGQNWVNVMFQTPFYYEGGNLVMLVQRPMDTQYYDSNDKFYCYTLGNLTARRVYSDNTVFDPANPPDAATGIYHYQPKTMFYHTTTMFGTLTGTVRDPQNQPVAGATVTIIGTGQTTLTDSLGMYSVQYVPQSVQQVTVSKPGYITQMQMVTILGNNTAVLHFVLQPITTVNVSGYVANSNLPTEYIAQAEVVLNGSASLATMTQTSGRFDFMGVPANGTYGIHVSKQGFLNYDSTFQTTYVDLNLPRILLQEIAVSPDSVMAVAAHNNTFNISWLAPIQDTSRVLQGYRVWRLLPGQETNQAAWTLLTYQLVTGTVYSDVGYVHPSIGTWTVKWAVKAVYSGGQESAPAFSNGIVGGIPNGLLSGTVTNIDNHFPLFGVTISINPGAHILQTDYNGLFEQVLWNGNYTVSASLVNYTGAETDVTITDGDTTVCNLQLDLVEANPDTPEVEAATALLGCHPNPFRSQASISYSIKEPVYTTLEIYNILGQKIRTLVKADAKAGRYSAVWNGTDNSGRQAANGIYYYRMTAGNYSSSGKIVLLK